MAEEVKTAVEKKAEEVKAAAKAAEKPVKEAVAKKPAAKKTTARKTTKKAVEPTVEFVIQYDEGEEKYSDIVENAKKSYLANNENAEIKDIKVYLKPVDKKAYCVVNGTDAFEMDVYF